MDVKRDRMNGRKPRDPQDDEARTRGQQSGSGPFAGTIPHGNPEPTRAGPGAGNRQAESRHGSSDEEPHEQSENSPMRPRRTGKS